MTIGLLNWIAVDWGTSHLRANAMGPKGVIAERSSEDGMGKLTRDGYEPALIRLIEDWLGSGVTDVLVCGMAGARQGWIEASYRQVPCTPVGATELTLAPTRDPRIMVQIVPGLSQAEPADVIRGEETQIGGALVVNPGFDGVICLPGTHSKWVHISAGEVVSFQSFMTGELFALLSTQSVLRFGIAPAGWNQFAFDQGLSDALSRPERIAAQLLGLRAMGLLNGLEPVAARSRLSGLLIGAELAAARPYWLGQDVILIGAADLSRAYASALASQGVKPRQLDAKACTLAGLTVARNLARR